MCCEMWNCARSCAKRLQQATNRPISGGPAFCPQIKCGPTSKWHEEMAGGSLESPKVIYTQLRLCVQY